LWCYDISTNISDLLFLHMSMQQLQQPLQQFGMVYREYSQSVIDRKEGGM